MVFHSANMPLLKINERWKDDGVEQEKNDTSPGINPLMNNPY